VNKFLKNWSLVRGILILSIMSLFSVLLIGGLGIYDMAKINQNIESMYADNLTPIADLGVINKNVLSMKYNISEAINNGYHINLYDELARFEEENSKLIEKFKNGNIENDEKELLDNFKSKYMSYTGVWKSMKGTIENGGEITANYKSQFMKLGDETTTTLDSLVQYNQYLASELNDEATRVFQTSNKLIMLVFVLTLLMVSLLSAAIILVVRSSLKDIDKVIKTVAEGDFSIKFDTSNKNEFGRMKKALGAMISNISHMMSTVNSSSEKISENSDALAAVSQQMTASSQEVANAITEVAKGAQNQAEELTDMSSIVHKFAKELDTIVASIKEVDDNARNTDKKANEGNIKLQALADSIQSINTAFREVSDKITTLGASIKGISDITDAINNIADQTNLLALNAAIEAARAGESGKGFAVVANEIRKLAEQSKTSSSDINQLILNISGEASVAVNTSQKVIKDLSTQMETIDNTVESFREIIYSISEILPKIENISSATDRINEQKNTIMEKVESASAVAEEASATAEEITASAEEMSASSQEVASTAQNLTGITQNMLDELRKFKL